MFASLVLASDASANPAASPATPAVQTEMRNVTLHVDDAIVLEVRRLRGELVPTKPGEPPTFDEKDSFVVRVDSAEVAIDVGSLSRLLNRYVFDYAGSPLRAIDVKTVDGAVELRGTLRKGVDVPFSIRADVRVDRNAELRLHPSSIKALGIPAKRLLQWFGVELASLVRLKGDRGVRVDGDDFVLNTARLLPPPRIEGRLRAVRVEPGRIVELFGPGRAAPLHPPEPNTNYMYYRGGVLRFGKLTMTDADLELIDERPDDPFDFFQDRYNDQLVAGYSKNTPTHGLKVYMPDYRRLPRGRPAAAP